MGKHITVVGAGVVGLASAARLVQRGHRVTVLDPRPPGEYCSYGNAGCLSRASCVPLGLPGIWRKVPGWLADPTGPLSIRWRHLPTLAPWLWQFHRATAPARVAAIADALHALLDPAIERWRTLAQWAGVPDLIVQQGYALAYDSPAAFAADAFGRELRRQHGVTLDVLQGAAIREFDPALSPRTTHLVLLPEQGHCPNPLRLSQALAQALRRAGTTFVQRSARAFEHAGGRVTHVITDGDPIAADVVLVAAGAHANALSSQVGDAVPLTTERGYHVMLAAPSVVPRVPVMSGTGKYFATAMEDGLRIAGTVELASLDAPADWRRADALLAGALALFPALRHGSVARWMGHRPSMPDSLPVLGRASRAENVLFAFGHGHVGLTAAAPTADIVADLVDGRASGIDIRPFAAGRFRARRVQESSDATAA
jgi:D-amino-acid dehydrogenase